MITPCLVLTLLTAAPDALALPAPPAADRVLLVGDEFQVPADAGQGAVGSLISDSAPQYRHPRRTRVLTPATKLTVVLREVRSEKRTDPTRPVGAYASAAGATTAVRILVQRE